MLILGAGYVSEPVVEYLSRDSNISITLGNHWVLKLVLDNIWFIYFYFSVSAIKNEADKVASKYPQAHPVSLDVLRSPEELEKLIKNHQIVIRYIYSWSMQCHDKW